MNDQEREEKAESVACMLDGKALDHVADLFRENAELAEISGLLMSDERMRVRLGATAVLEELARENAPAASGALPFLLPLLRHEHSLVRGDALNVLGILGGTKVLPELRALLQDPDPRVVEVARDVIEELEGEAAGDSSDRSETP